MRSDVDFRIEHSLDHGWRVSISRTYVGLWETTPKWRRTLHAAVNQALGERKRP